MPCYSQVRGLTKSLLASLVLHLVIFSAFYWWQSSNSKTDVAGLGNNNDDFFAVSDSPEPADITEIGLVDSATLDAGEKALEEDPSETVLAGETKVSAETSAKAKARAKARTRARARARARAKARAEAEATAIAEAEAKAGSTPTQPDAGTNAEADTAREKGTTGQSGGLAAALSQRSRVVTAWDGLPLLEVTPPGDTTAVLVRFDKLRSTPWGKVTEEVFAPMPDYQLFIQSSSAKGLKNLRDEFDILFVSTKDARDVTQTQISARSVAAPASLQTRLEHPQSKIQWAPYATGVLGNRMRGPRMYRGDSRKFFLGKNGWAFLVKGTSVPSLLSDGDDSMNAKLKRIADIAETPNAPVVVAQISPVPVSLKKIGLRGVERPRSVTAFVDIAGTRQAGRGGTGLRCRGFLDFSSAESAARFASAAKKRLEEVQGNPLMIGFLHSANALNAVSKLQILAKDDRVLFSTSISNADGKALFSKAAALLDIYYNKNK